MALPFTIKFLSSFFNSFYLGHLPDALRAQKEAGNDEIVPLGLVLYWLEQVKSSVAVVFVLHRPIVFTVDPENIKVLLKQYMYLSRTNLDIEHQFSVTPITRKGLVF